MVAESMPSAHPYLAGGADRLKWLKDRKRGLGASDVASLYGIGFLKVDELYADKANPEPEEKPLEERMRLGLELEPCVAARYEETTGYKLLPSPGVTQSKDLEIAYASLDRVREDKRPVELKCIFGPPGGSQDWTIEGDGWGPAGTDQIKLRYILQTQWQMGAVGEKIADVAALFVGFEFRIYHVEFNPSLYEAMKADAKDFWQYVADKRPIGRDWIPKRLADVRALGARMIPGSATMLPPSSQGLIDQYESAAMHEKLYEASKNDAKAQLEKMLGHYETGLSPNGSKVKRVEMPARDVAAYRVAASSHVRVYPKKGKK